MASLRISAVTLFDACVSFLMSPWHNEAAVNISWFVMRLIPFQVFYESSSSETNISA